ncbi:MAG: hypothetical protein OEV85_01735 [Candidatus Thorarchaeota archaeon]|nr:hypothetical protein [Candidatus Thorarchaeota archaeon]
MNDENRIPEKRPILYELFCPKCGGSLYALDEEEIYIGRSDQTRSPAGFTITKLECVLCREEFIIEGFGLKYETSIADELGWPFPTQIPDGPSVIPEHLEKRMRKREQEPDPQGDSIDDYYADRFDRSPLMLEKEFLRYILKRKGRLARDEEIVDEIATPKGEGCYNSQILGVSVKFGVNRKRLPHTLHVSDFSNGDMIESCSRSKEGSILFTYYIVYNDVFQPIAISRK